MNQDRERSIQRAICERAKELLIEGIVQSNSKHWQITGARFKDPGVEVVMLNKSDKTRLHRVRVTIEYLDAAPVGVHKNDR